MKKFFISNIDYDMTDSMGNIEIDLPTKLVICCNDEEEIADKISDITNFCVNSFMIDKIQVMDDNRKSVNVNVAEQILINKANTEQIEDRFYELAQNLVNNYIDEIESKYQIADNEDGEQMWYDEARDTAMKILFEKIGSMYSK